MSSELFADMVFTAHFTVSGQGAHLRTSTAQDELVI